MAEATHHDLRSALSGEWLDTNGMGGYASSTLLGTNTRRYHGLLVAATEPPVGRVVMLSKIEETLVINGQRFELSTNQYPGMLHPAGYQYFRQFCSTPFPRMTFVVDGITIHKTVLMPYGRNQVVVQYELDAPTVRPCQLELRPLIAFRDYHSLTHRNDALNGTLMQDAGCIKLQPYFLLPSLYFAHDAANILPDSDWYLNFEYEVERERGLDHSEDLFNPFTLLFDLDAARCRAAVIAGTTPEDIANLPQIIAGEKQRRESILAGSSNAGSAPLEPQLDALLRAADQFIVARGKHKTVIAGYHWFCDWGRDTMISLPGLALATGGLQIARDILVTFIESLTEGMLPNRFPDRGEAPEFNTVDATLWLFHAAERYWAYSGDDEFVLGTCYPALKDVVAHHVRGTRHNIHVDADGLLFAGEPGFQLTWMDARIGDWVVTPRIGKPVEIQALWYNALCVMQALAQAAGEAEESASLGAMAKKAQVAFHQQFWNGAEGCLFDVSHGDERDGAIRPNQVFSISLPHPILERARWGPVLAAVECELLTPMGLRTLSPRDSRYVGRYQGNVEQRDGAYHQGTVWPWLLGHFVTAYVKHHGGSAAVRQEARGFLTPLLKYAAATPAGQLPEVFDGDLPQAAGGCMAQAWSVAELLRSYIEDVSGRVPSARPSALSAGQK
jgi:predicted glycogen debranching enzyme